MAVTAAVLIAVPPLAGLVVAGFRESRPDARAEIAAPAPEPAVPVAGSWPEDGTTGEATGPADVPPTLAQTPPDPATLTAGPGGPQGAVDTGAPTPGTVEQRGAAALALIDYPWERTGYALVFAGPNQGLMGLTEGSRKQITIYVRPGQSARSIAWVLGHEIGHAVDFTMTTDAERAEYRRIRGLGDRPWYPCSNCSDYASPAGDWAETFAAWLLGDGPFASQLGPRPTAAQLAALTPIFAADPAPITPPSTRPPTVTTTTRSVAPGSAPKAQAPKSTTTVPRTITWRWRPATPTTTKPTPTTNPRPPTPTTTRAPSTPTTWPVTTTTRPPSTTTTRCRPRRRHGPRPRRRGRRPRRPRHRPRRPPGLRPRRPSPDRPQRPHPGARRRRAPKRRRSVPIGTCPGEYQINGVTGLA